MEAEFRATGVPRARRGAITDGTLAFINRCFAHDEVSANGQDFLFLPRPERPPIIVGGAAEHAFARIVAHADGWMPYMYTPEMLTDSSSGAAPPPVHCQLQCQRERREICTPAWGPALRPVIWT